MASNIFTNTTNDKAVTFSLPASGTGLTLRIFSQPLDGSVGLSNSMATYSPSPGFVGTESFTFAAYDGAKNSNLATGTVAVAQGPFSLGVVGHAPPGYPARWPVAFVAVPVVTNSISPVTFLWDFGDGTGPSSEQFAQHTYTLPGSYTWKVVATIDAANATNQGTIQIQAPVSLTIVSMGNLAMLQWPYTIADAVLEGTESLGDGAVWQAVTNTPGLDVNTLKVSVPATDERFFRLRRAW